MQHIPRSWGLGCRHPVDHCSFDHTAANCDAHTCAPEDMCKPVSSECGLHGSEGGITQAHINGSLDCYMLCVVLYS